MDFMRPDRRKLLSGIAASSLTFSPLGQASNEALLVDQTQSRRLKFFNTHTGEKLDVEYYADGIYLEEELNQLNILMRDHRQNEAIVMDKRLFDQIWQIQHTVGAGQTIEIISGYRSPTTNALLRKRSNGVARKSFHMYGKAIDFRLRHTRLSEVRKAALALKAGGVGYYRRSDFIHIDTGPVRSWS